MVDDFVSREEDEIAEAISALAANEHLITEGAGAVATAALLRKNLVKPGEIAVIMVTGANIDEERFVTTLRTSRGEA